MRSTFKTVLVAMLAVLALSAVAASAAQAEEAPYFKIAGTRLTEGSSKEFTAKSSEIVISIGSVGLECSFAPASEAKLLGSIAGNHGNAEMTLEFTSCSVTKPGCKVIETIKTEPLLAKLVSLGDESEREKGREKAKGMLGVLIVPKKGVTFMHIKFNKEGCNLSVIDERLEGSVAAELLNGEGYLEIGKEPAEAKTLQLRFPGQPITHVWEVRGGEGKEVQVEKLKAALDQEASMAGTSTLELAGSPLWGVFD